MTTETTALSPAELAAEAFDAVNRRDLERIAELQHEDVREEIVALESVFTGRTAMRSFFEELFAAVPDLRFDVVRITGDDRVAWVQWRFSGTFNGGRYQGIEATGSRVEVQGADCMEWDGGRLRRNTIFYDGAGFARQIGMLPRRDSAGDRGMLAAFNAVTRLRRRRRRA